MPERVFAHIVAVGTELLGEARVDTNSLFLTSRLHSIGVEVVEKTVVPDDQSRIVRCFKNALVNADIVVITGGLGPTTDDLTRESVAEALGLNLELDPRALRRLRARYRMFKVTMTENNQRQALVPEGAVVLDNPNGTAPGLFIETPGHLVFLLPGPPRELKPMVDDSVVPIICRARKLERRVVRHLRVASIPESSLDSRISRIYRRYPNVETTLLSSPGIIDVFLLWKGTGGPAEASLQLDQLVRAVREELGSALFAEEDLSLPDVVGRQLCQRGLRLAVAESCTGGLVGKLLTEVPGSSDYFLGGVVSYSNQLKETLLGVSQEVIEKHGAVSEETAAEMARGVLGVTGADIGLSVTGIAGPGGGLPDKPVGTVCFGFAFGSRQETCRLLFPGEREIVRLRAARYALDWLRRELVHEDFHRD